jgi:DNA-binding GntR family transcriptional regulator
MVRRVGNDQGGIDPDGEIAPYLQLADILRRQIGSGDLPPGARLPSVIKLAERYGIARVTAYKSVRLLVDEGLVVVSRGRGVFVRRDRGSAR